jgi:5'-3' exoribonuclease 1
LLFVDGGAGADGYSPLCLFSFVDGYLNESGTIQTTRLQVVLDEMSRWEQEVFEREYADVNWFKGKQAEYADGGERTAGKVKGQLGADDLIHVFLMQMLMAPAVLTQSQRTIFEKVQAFVLAKLSPFPSHPPSARTPPNSQVSARLVFQNTYAARDRHFISELAEALGVLVAWDEYDGEKNLIVLRVPWVRAERRRLSTGLGEGDELDGVEEVLGESLGQGLGGEEGEGEGGEAEDGVWEDVDDNDEDEDNLGDGSGSQGRDRRGGSKEGRASASGSGDDSDGESRAAVLRVLKKYEAARVLEPDEAGAFDARASQSGRERMDGWKRGYYQVRCG